MQRKVAVVKDIIFLAAGCALMVLAYAYFLVPNRIAPGGLTGIATVLYYAAGLPVGVTVFVLNIPLFAMSFKRMGALFGIKSFVCMMAVSLLIDALPEVNLTQNDVLLSCAYGGGLLGLGLGLILRGGATTGGTDLAARLIHERAPVLSMGKLIFAVDCLVVVLAGVVFDAAQALYSLAALFISSYVVDITQEGLNAAKAFFIISDSAERIAQRIMNELDRGATALNGTGMYTREQKSVLFCVLNRSEVVRLKAIVREEDPAAFVIVNDVREAMGEGFMPHGK